jgi:NADH-quinone oxidoreductase subunit L
MDGFYFNGSVYRWMELGELSFDIGFLIDPLSAIMMVVVTFVSLMVHIYTIGYMAEEEGYNRFFSYISLFTFAMLMLVMSNNLLQLFFGWEAVGVVSYLLIGFYYERQSAVFANMKAFLVNRVGDFGFILGIGLLLAGTGSMNYDAIFAQNTVLAAQTLPGTDWNLVTVACICLFIGAMGKSAQFPLHVWLPDSMEGPTPISALIHAATMVTAGIFMVSRMSPLFELSDVALSFILVIGSITALFMGFLGIVQTDIKRVVAYSTLSQLGFMTIALGVSAYPIAIFHLMTHAFFKALLFLGAGSVILGMHHEQDMRKMGALRVAMPVTAFTFIIGWLAIAGVPPFAGFWSKDEILLYVYADNRLLYVVGMVTALLTAYYMTRQVIMVFFGEARWHDAASEHGAHGDFHPHESPKVMLVPLVVLAALSVVGGAMQLPFSKDLHFLGHWLEPVVQDAERSIKGTWAYDNKFVLLLAAIVVAFTGIALSVAVYAKRRLPTLEPKILENAWLYDATVARLVGGPGAGVFQAVTNFDAKVVDGAVNGAGAVTRGLGTQVRRSQSGFVRAYAVIISLGTMVVLAWFVWRGWLA